MQFTSYKNILHYNKTVIKLRKFYWSLTWSRNSNWTTLIKFKFEWQILAQDPVVQYTSSEFAHWFQRWNVDRWKDSLQIMHLFYTQTIYNNIYNSKQAVYKWITKLKNYITMYLSSKLTVFLNLFYYISHSLAIQQSEGVWLAFQ
jgi:hypothetical protein